MIQFGWCILPVVSQLINLTIIQIPDKSILPLFLYEEKLDYSVEGLGSFSKDYNKIWLVSGPEGGFSESEVDFFKKSGWKTVWLGNRLFRMDTAPIIALANILAPSWF